MQDKIGLTLDDIHFKGAVPNYADKYQRSMNRFFGNLREDKLVERNNVRPLPSSCSSRARADSSSSRSQYFFQVDEHLDWSEKTNGTEAIFDHFHKGPQADLVEKTREVVHPTAATRCVGALSSAIL